MMNQIKELKNKNNNRFIIEITLIQLESQKKIIISLFITAPVTVLELKKYLSKDLDFPIQNMIFFYPIRGIIDNSYIFFSEPNTKIELSLIIDDKKNESNKIKPDISINNKDSKNISNNININILKKNNNRNLNNNFKNISNYKNYIISKDLNYKFIKPFDDIKDFKFLNYKNLYENKNNSNDININDVNINKEKKNKKEEKKNNNKFDMNNNNLYQIKNNKHNFFLTTTDNRQKTLDEHFLGKKRTIPTTFKTTILKNENENIKHKNMKLQNNNNIKIVNFSVNKSLLFQNEKK